jgi:hypothetical protein
MGLLIGEFRLNLLYVLKGTNLSALTTGGYRRVLIVRYDWILKQVTSVQLNCRGWMMGSLQLNF